MAHIQNKPADTHESESKKDFKLVNASAVASAGSQSEHQSEVKHVNAAKVAAATSGKSDGLEILGFRWQFVAVMAVIVLGVLVIIIKSIFGL